MPKEDYAPLTEQERTEIVARWENYVTKINAWCEKQGYEKIDVDKSRKELYEKMNNQDMVARYRISKQIQEKHEAYANEGKNLILHANRPANQQAGQVDNTGKVYVDLGNHYLSRTINFLLKTDGSEESKKYNQDLLKCYAKNPVEFTHVRLKNLMTYDPKELMEIGNDKTRLLEFYRDNMALCSEANEFGDSFRQQSFGAVPELMEGKESMKVMIQKINFAGSSQVESGDLDFFATPTVPQNDNLITDLVMRDREVFGKKKTRTQMVLFQNMRANNVEQKSFHDYLKSLEEKGMKIDKDVFLKYKVVETNPETGAQKQVTTDDLLKNKPNVTLQQRSKEEIEAIKRISKAYSTRYSNEFQKRMGEKLHTNYNVFQVIKDNKGSIFSSDSREYKEYVAALADYTNPEKPGYLNKENLRAKTQAYLDHTKVDRPERNETNVTRRGRVNLAENTLRVLDEMETNKDKIRSDINIDINKSVPFALSDKKGTVIDLDELDDSKQVNQKEHKTLVLDLDESLDDDLNKSNEL